jgi:hypothetical protein
VARIAALAAQIIVEFPPRSCCRSSVVEHPLGKKKNSDARFERPELSARNALILLQKG